MRHLSGLFTTTLLVACSMNPGRLEAEPPPAPTATPGLTAGQEVRPVVAPALPNTKPSLAEGVGNPSAPDAFSPFAKTDAATVARLVKSQNAFATDLYTRVAVGKNNVAMSPASISLAFGMVYAGARDDTAAQMAHAFRYNLPQAELHAAFGTVLRGLVGGKAKRPYELSVANRLFGEKTRDFTTGFTALTEDHYKAPLELLSFASSPEPARKHINEWVESQTKKRITGLLPPGSIDTDSVLVLTNAIYFKGVWAQEFAEGSTQVDTFKTPNGNMKANMMRAKGEHFFAHVDGAKMLQLPYKGDELAMQLFLPDADDGLASLEASLKQGALGKLSSKRSIHAVDVTIPRFTIDPSKPTALSDVLKAMGLVDAWDKERANLRGMANLLPTENIYLQQAFHKAFVEVNEEGTEAAAATAVIGGVTTTTARPTPPPPAVFKADHPFLFVIRDLKTNAILFIGRVNDPTTKE